MVKKKNTSKSFLKELIKSRKGNSKKFKPRVSYDREYDIIYIWFGGDNKVESTIEVSSDMRFDIDKKLNILSVEIENFSSYLKDKRYG